MKSRELEQQKKANTHTHTNPAVLTLPWLFTGCHHKSSTYYITLLLCHSIWIVNGQIF